MSDCEDPSQADAKYMTQLSGDNGGSHPVLRLNMGFYIFLALFR